MVSLRSIIAGCWILAGILFCFPAVGGAFQKVGPEEEKYPYIDDRGSIGLGVMHPYLDSQFQVNPKGLAPGTVIDAEKDLGLETGQVRLFGDVIYRVSRRSSFSLTFLEIARKATRTINRDIQYGDQTFTANAVLDVSLSTRYYLLAYRYAFVRNSFVEFGASAGFNIADISTGLHLNTTLTGPENTRANARGKDAGVIAPVPLAGVFFSAQVLPKTFIRNTIQYIAGEIGGVGFKSLNYVITLDYSPWRNIALGVGAYTNRLEIDKAANFDGRFNTSINSSLAYARYFF